MRPSPTVGSSWTDSLEGTIGVATHHDGMSGTERQDVADDYSQRISESHEEVEVGVAKSFQKFSGKQPTNQTSFALNQKFEKWTPSGGSLPRGPVAWPRPDRKHGLGRHALA